MPARSEQERLARQWAQSTGSDSASSDDTLLDPAELDSILNGADESLSGVQALINSTLVSYERLPMLEIVFDRLVRLATTSLRAFTSDNVEISIESISSVRFGDYLDSLPQPAVIAVFKAEEWDNFALLNVDADLVYSMIDVLLGGRRVGAGGHLEARTYTPIELSLAQRMIEIVLEDTQNAFEPVTQVTFRLERLETNPRFAAITRPANAAILVELRVSMDDRSGKIEILLPYATIEPIRDLLLQMFMGEKFGRDPIWEGHLATEIFASDVEIEAVLHEFDLPLSRMLRLEAGDTVMFDRAPSDPVRLRCGEVELTEAIMGHIGSNVSVRVTQPLSPPKVTMASFEAFDTTTQEKR